MSKPINTQAREQAAGPATPCAHTARLDSTIAIDVVDLMALVDDMIGGHDANAGAERLGVLVCLNNTMARVGAMADAIAASHGEAPCPGDLCAWMFINGNDRLAMRALAQLRQTSPPGVNGRPSSPHS